MPDAGGLMLSWQPDAGAGTISLWFPAGSEEQAASALLLLRLHAALQTGDEAAVQQLIAKLQVSGRPADCTGPLARQAFPATLLCSLLNFAARCLLCRPHLGLSIHSCLMRRPLVT